MNDLTSFFGVDEDEAFLIEAEGFRDCRWRVHENELQFLSLSGRWKTLLNHQRLAYLLLSGVTVIHQQRT